MSYSETVEKEACNMLLNNGTDSQGNIKTVTQSLGSLNKNNWNADKVGAVASALERCLSKTISALRHVRTTTMRED